MKSLNTYIKEKLIINQRFDEKLIVNKNYNPYKYPHKYNPKTCDELREIIEQRYEEQGPGTKRSPIDFNDIDVYNIDSFNDEGIGLFQGTKFEYIDLSNWDVSNVKDMDYMFAYCKQLKSIGDLSNWDVSNVRYMNSMFDKCEKLESVGDLSNWLVSKVKNMSYMFKDSGIKNIPNWYKE